MTTYYLSGPMRGLPGHNYDVFNAVEAALLSQRLDSLDTIYDCVLNPARNFDGDSTLPTNDYMTEDLKQVLSADVIVLLPGFSESEGSKKEVEVGKWTGKRFMFAYAPDAAHDQWAFAEVDIPSIAQSPREQSLRRALGYICGDRNAAYGPPTQDFKRTADLWTAFGFRFLPHDGAELQPIAPHHIANAQILLKQSRLAWQPTKADSWDDTSGYSACGHECVVSEES